jgi:hypothetical protein
MYSDPVARAVAFADGPTTAMVRADENFLISIHEAFRRLGAAAR